MDPRELHGSAASGRCDEQWCVAGLERWLNELPPTPAPPARIIEGLLCRCARVSEANDLGERIIARDVLRRGGCCAHDASYACVLQTLNNACWYSDRGGSGWHIRKDNSVCSDLCVRSDANRAENFCPGPNIDVASDLRNTRPIVCSDSHLLKYQTIHPDPGLGMDHDSIRMRDEQAPADTAAQRYVSTRHDAPEAMAQDKPLARQNGDRSLLAPPMLVASDSSQKLSAGIPKTTRSLARPVRNVSAYRCPPRPLLNRLKH